MRRTIFYIALCVCLVCVFVNSINMIICFVVKVLSDDRHHYRSTMSTQAVDAIQQDQLLLMFFGNVASARQFCFLGKRFQSIKMSKR